LTIKLTQHVVTLSFALRVHRCGQARLSTICSTRAELADLTRRANCRLAVADWRRVYCQQIQLSKSFGPACAKAPRSRRGVRISEPNNKKPGVERRANSSTHGGTNSREARFGITLYS